MRQVPAIDEKWRGGDWSSRIGNRKPWGEMGWHANKWFSGSNGRVVIVSANYELTIVGEPQWEISPEEEERQRLANEQATTGYR